MLLMLTGSSQTMALMAADNAQGRLAPLGDKNDPW
jgi:hypothetical protein